MTFVTDLSRPAQTAETAAIYIGARAEGVDAETVIGGRDTERTPAWPEIEVQSAGSMPTRNKPLAVEAMAEIGIDISSKSVTAHLVVPIGPPGHGFLSEIAEGLADEFGIGHSTIQIERSDDPACRLAPADIP